MKILLDDLEQIKSDIAHYEQMITETDDTYYKQKWRKRLNNLRNKRSKLEARISSYNEQYSIDFSGT